MRKSRNYVLDVNVWVSACIANKLPLLFRRALVYHLNYYVSTELMFEMDAVLQYPDVARKLSHRPARYSNVIADFVEHAKAQDYVGSPDPKDDYLIGACFSTRSALVTSDRLLLHWSTAPIEIISTRDFVSKFPLL